MRGYKPCSTHRNRGCWLKGPGKEYNITTDYEKEYPMGITRKYYLEASTMTLYPDGVAMTEGKVFNRSYPGPWIQACWGDQLEITVKNSLPKNGTTIHWHGLRQLGSVEMDGVNAITQCPIAPGDSFTYKFRAMQYGSSWYHSHYSLQYADGLVGPMTIYGPSSANYDTAKDPILMTDWNHRSAFEDWAASIQPNGTRPKMTSILLNGIGQYTPLQSEVQTGLTVATPAKYSMVFQKGVRYLLRLINTSVDTTFIFSIDNHNITVIGADFVPIQPYTNNSVLIGIGQRYHVIVEANPLKHSPDGKENFWIRTTPADGCKSFHDPQPDEKTGILRYDALSTDDPVTERGDFSDKCSDETYSSLKPILPWRVGLDVQGHRTYDAGLVDIPGPPYYPERKMNRWELHDYPMWLNFSRPTVLNLDTDFAKERHLVVVETDYAHNSWIELLILGAELNDPAPPDRVVPLAAHPIHLHGHDFALLAQSESLYDPDEADKLIQRENPPRRDVALLPRGGYLIIAFKADNPGAWLMHCHIAWHASSGLALQILENKDKIKLSGKTRKALQKTCRMWDEWVKDRVDEGPLQDDSGI
jgi:FtsP/CotA-like multicopper oxidase with cupredoxin domain